MILEALQAEYGGEIQRPAYPGLMVGNYWLTVQGRVQGWAICACPRDTPTPTKYIYFDLADPASMDRLDELLRPKR